MHRTLRTHIIIFADTDSVSRMSDTVLGQNGKGIAASNCQANKDHIGC